MSHDPDKKIKIVFSCLDWRLHPQIEEYFTQGGAGCDSCVTAGSVKDLINPETRTLFLKQIEISKKLHNCQGVALTMHMDCGAYGGASAFSGESDEIANCKNELEKAARVVAENFPELPIEKYIISLAKTVGGWEIALSRI